MVEQYKYKEERRADNIQKLLTRTVEIYANGLELFATWSARGATSWRTVEDEMRKHEGSTAAQLKYIRNEIEMRVIGLGWLQFETRWSSVQDESVGSLTSLKALLKDILVHEAEERRLKRLPTEAAPPPLKMRTLKELGESSADAMEIAGQVIPPSPRPRTHAQARQN